MLRGHCKTANTTVYINSIPFVQVRIGVLEYLLKQHLLIVLWFVLELLISSKTQRLVDCKLQSWGGKITDEKKRTLCSSYSRWVKKGGSELAVIVSASCLYHAHALFSAHPLNSGSLMRWSQKIRTDII